MEIVKYIQAVNFTVFVVVIGLSSGEEPWYKTHLPFKNIKTINPLSKVLKIHVILWQP